MMGHRVGQAVLDLVGCAAPISVQYQFLCPKIETGFFQPKKPVCRTLDTGSHSNLSRTQTFSSSFSHPPSGTMCFLLIPRYEINTQNPRSFGRYSASTVSVKFFLTLMGEGCCPSAQCKPWDHFLHSCSVVPRCSTVKIELC
jgi:hypothetical protein